MSFTPSWLTRVKRQPPFDAGWRRVEAATTFALATRKLGCLPCRRFPLIVSRLRNGAGIVPRRQVRTSLVRCNFRQLWLFPMPFGGDGIPPGSCHLIGDVNATNERVRSSRNTCSSRWMAFTAHQALSGCARSLRPFGNVQVQILALRYDGTELFFEENIAVYLFSIKTYVMIMGSIITAKLDQK